MVKNYLKIAIRNIIRNKGHFAINIIGISIGMAACLLLFLWVQDELSYDRFHKKAGQIYRVIQQNVNNTEVSLIATTPAPLGPALLDEFPWIQKIVRFVVSRGIFVQSQEKRFKEDIIFVDPEIFDVFDFPLVSGDHRIPLKEPNSLLISEAMKKKYFGNEDPIGKTLTFNKRRILKITGVFKNIPSNSHIHFDLLGSLLDTRKDYFTQWGVSNYYTYILTTPDAPIFTFDQKMRPFIVKYMGEKSWDVYKIRFFLQSLTSIHLQSQVTNELEPNRDILIIYFFSVIAFFILLLACLNYINLATARFSSRFQEIGLRKVLGAAPSHLSIQFLYESLLSAIVAVPPGLLAAELFLPLFNSLSGKTLAFHYFENWPLLAVLLGIILFVGIISGFFPAFIASAVNPIEALKGKRKANPTTSMFRRILVVFQFFISVLFIGIVLIISGQLHYMRTKDLGFNKENIVNIHLMHSEEAQLKWETLKQEFLKNSGVIAAGASDFFPGSPRWNMNYWHDGVPPGSYMMIGGIPVDYDFLETLQINIVEGRAFSRHFPQDEQDKNASFIINESTRKKFGWTSAVGENFNLSNWKIGKIVGVVQDFHFNSLRGEIEPVVLYIDPGAFEYISLRIAPGNISKILRSLENSWKKLIPDQPFIFSFLDDDFLRLYSTELKFQKIFSIVTLLTILISCLGLYGLSAFAAEMRTKEIGIRKVFGASVPGIMLMLAKDIVRWIAVANMIAWPIAWYAMNKWLQNFAYRIRIDIWIFLAAALITVTVALLTISYKAFKAATADPVKTLRCE